MSTLRFATIGSSGICERFLDALPQCENASYVGCYSRDLERAKTFGRPYGASIFFDSLDELAASPEIDAIYIASPGAIHAEQALKLIAGGKHVLVEKTFASNYRQAKAVFDAANSAGVFAMEAMRNLHTPGFFALEDALKTIGTPRLAHFAFSKVTSRIAKFRAGERVPILDPKLSSGALTDIGVYVVEPAIALFGVPDNVISSCVTSQVPGTEAGESYSLADLAGQIMLTYGSDLVVNLSYGKISDNRCDSQIEGEEATLVFDEVACPREIKLFPHIERGMLFETIEEKPVPVEVTTPQNDMVSEITDFIEAVLGDERARAHLKRCEGVTLESLKVMDEVRASAGVRFPADDEQS